MDLHHALAAAQKPGVAVGIAGAKGGYLGGLFGGKAAAVAGALAGLHLLDHAHHGLEGHHRAETAKAHLVAGVVAVQDDAGARHAALPGQPLRPVRVQHDPGRVVAVHKGRLPPGGLQRVESFHEQCVLFGGIGHIFRGSVIGHGKMLEQAGHFQPGQRTGFQHLPDGGVKIGAQGKADAPHTGVGLEVDVHPAARRHGGFAQGACLRKGVAGHSDVVLDQGGGVGGLYMPQNEDGQSLPRLAQLHSFGQAADRQPCGALLGEHSGALYRAVAVAVRLDHCAQGQRPCPGLYLPEIIPKGLEVDLGPDVFFKRLFLHDLFPFLVR